MAALLKRGMEENCRSPGPADFDVTLKGTVRPLDDLGLSC